MDLLGLKQEQEVNISVRIDVIWGECINLAWKKWTFSK